MVAGASYAAVRAAAAFTLRRPNPLMIGQMQVLDVPGPPWPQPASRQANSACLTGGEAANSTDPADRRLHGGYRDIEVRTIAESPVGLMLVVHLIYDCRDAMGATMVNTACEVLAPLIEEMTGGR